MLAFFTLSPLFCTSFFSVFVFVFFGFMYFISESSLFFTQATLDSSAFFVADTVAVYMVYMLFFVVLVSSFFLPGHSSLECFTLGFIIQFCFWVFTSVSLVCLYFFYEASLFPILYIILKWGSYPERSLSAFMLLTYTVVFTLPFIYVIFYVFLSFGTFNLLSVSYFSSNFTQPLLIAFIVFLAFAVKLPIYGLHFWLPMAHVEAPTFGSMILAGVLLNLGGVGMLRLSPIIAQDSLLQLISGYLVFGLAFVALVCCFQSDFKRLVAFSSVSHMIALPPLLIFDTISSSSAVVLLMLFHGLSSPLLFMLVGVSYSSFSSRQFIFIRGFLLVSPLVSAFLIFSFLFTMSAPPFPSFVSEVFFIMSVISWSPIFMPFIFIFAFLSLVYSLLWLASMVFGPSVPISGYPMLSFSSIIGLSSGLLLSAVFLVFLTF